MVHHERVLREIEKCDHGTMTAQERLARITKIIQEWRIEMEEEHNLPFAEIRPNVLPPLNRARTLAFAHGIIKQSAPGRRTSEIHAPWVKTWLEKRFWGGLNEHHRRYPGIPIPHSMPEDVKGNEEGRVK